MFFSAKQQQFLKSQNWPMEKEFGGEPSKPNEPSKPTDGGGGGHEKAEESSYQSSQSSSVGFNFGPAGSRAQATSNTEAGTAVKAGVDTSAVLSMLQKTAAFAAVVSAGSSKPPQVAPAASLSGPAATHAGVKTGGVDTSAVLNMLQLASQKTAVLPPVKSAQQAKTETQISPSEAPKEKPPDAKDIYLPDKMSAKLTQSEFDKKCAQKARSVSKANPDHESLSNIKAEIMAERGLARPRSRSRSPRSRSRRRDRDRDRYQDGRARQPQHAEL